MLSINSKYWIIILKLSSWFTFQRANKYVLGVLGKQKHQLLSHGRKTQSRNQVNKQEKLARMKGNAVNYEVGDLHDRFTSTNERTDELKRAPPKKRRNQIRSALVGNREAEAVQDVAGRGREGTALLRCDGPIFFPLSGCITQIHSATPDMENALHHYSEKLGQTCEGRAQGHSQVPRGNKRHTSRLLPGRWGRGDWVYATGPGTCKILLDSGKKAQAEGKYAVILERAGGTWAWVLLSEWQSNPLGKTS